MDFLSDMPPYSISHMFVWRSHAFAMFSAHALREWARLRVHIHMTIFTQFAQNCSIGSLLALYGSTMHVATH